MEVRLLTAFDLREEQRIIRHVLKIPALYIVATPIVWNVHFVHIGDSISQRPSTRLVSQPRHVHAPIPHANSLERSGYGTLPKRMFPNPEKNVPKSVMPPYTSGRQSLICATG